MCISGKNGNIHNIIKKQGTIALTAGKHPIKIEYFEGNYGEDLDLFYSGPGILRRPVPRSISFFE